MPKMSKAKAKRFCTALLSLLAQSVGYVHKPRRAGCRSTEVLYL